MAPVFLPELRLNAEITGPAQAQTLVFLHGLGTDLTIWRDLLALLPQYRCLAIDLRGHGKSDAPQGAYAMGAMIRDVEQVMAHFSISKATIIGHHLGGLIAQGLATKRPDLVEALILSNTAAKIGYDSQWRQQIAAVETGGLEAISQNLLTRWLGRKWMVSPHLPRLRTMLLATQPEGWCGAAAAMSGTDFYELTAKLILPVLVIAGDQDATTPPDLVRETAELMSQHRFLLLRGAGHLPMVEDAQNYADRLSHFLAAIKDGE